MAGTFSESWYRVAHVRAALRPTVSLRKQWYRGEEWFVLHDPYTGSYFRLSPSFYRFIAKLGFDRTIEELWLEALSNDPENAPGQQEVISLVNELNLASLLYFKDPADSAKLFERRWKKEKKQKRAKFKNILFLRFTFWNPDRFLEALLPLWRKVFSRLGGFIWLGVVLWGVKVVIEHAEEFSQDSGNLLDPNNLILLYLSTAFVKIFHEVGHGALCKRLGGEVHSLGIMFILFAPLPFVDASSSWTFRSKWHRILVSSGGMIVELFIGALASFVWAYSPPGLVHGLAYNIIFVATVSTLLFNANPLMRFDGYYILSDLIEVPNLTQKSKEQLYGVVERYVFGVKNVKLPARGRREGGWLITYGASSMIYRIVLLIWIVLFVADSYLILGVVLALVMGGMWFITPPVKFIKYLFHSPKLRQTRKRALSSVALVLGAGGFALLFVPLPRSFTAPGVVEAEISDVVLGSPGMVVQSLVKPGSHVEQGTALIKLENPELLLEIKKAKAQWKNVSIRERQALRQRGVDSSPISKRKESLKKLLSQLDEQKYALTIRARRSGIWVFPEAGVYKGQWLQRGDMLGQIISDGGFRFASVVSQEDASDLFGSLHPAFEVKLYGKAEQTIQVSTHKVLPHYQDKLPSAALGWQGGGVVAISSSDDTSGTLSQEPFYLLYSKLVQQKNTRLYHGQTGYVRVSMKPQTFFKQIVRRLRQFMQKRYQL